MSLQVHNQAANMDCPVCGAVETRGILSLEDWAYRQGELFEYGRCENCGVVIALDALTPGEMAEHYPASYSAYQDARTNSSSLKAISHRVGLAKRCRIVESLCDGGRLLDVGCSTGAFLEAMQAQDGWQVTGLEMDAGAAQIARSKGLDVCTGSVMSHEFDTNSFDVITLWDVLEHLESPADVLGTLRQWLVPNGWLVLRTPDANSLQARFFGRFWAGYDAPRHRVVYTHVSLERMLELKALRPKRLKGLTGSYALAVLSSQNWAIAHGWPARSVHAMRHPLLQALLWPATSLLDGLMGGAEMILAAQKHK